MTAIPGEESGQKLIHLGTDEFLVFKHPLSTKR